MNIITPYDSIETSITNQVLMCESIVVGEIPGTYYEFNNADEKMGIEIVE